MGRTGERPRSGPGSTGAARPDKETALNYRHHFHAGNFADLLKHALVLAALARLQAIPEPLSVLDTHAGAGVYDLTGDAAQRTGEAAQGIGRLLAAEDAPAVFAPLTAAVRALNGGGPLRLYPGSPLLVAERLRDGDRYLGCELRPDDQAALATTLRRFPGARARKSDGYEALAEPAPGPRRLVLVDPPFERGDDYQRTAHSVGAAAAARPQDLLLVWAPIKDLETFDAFLGALIAAGAGQGIVAEARLKPLDNPLRMNGCAMVVVGADAAGLAEPARAAAEWIVARLGEAGGRAVVAPLA